MSKRYGESMAAVAAARRTVPDVAGQIAGFIPKPLVWFLAAAYGALGAGHALANPLGASVVHGAASIVQSGKLTTITNSPGAIINWQSFSIASGETTRFIQQTVNSTVLNRVVGQDPSRILGTLSSNGRVFLVNPNGMVFGQGAVVDTAGLVLSTLNITDDDFKSGRMRFVGSAASGDLKIEGVVRSSSGDIYLIAPNVANAGAIKAENGNAILAAGEKVEIVGRGLDGITFEVQNKSNTALNLGSIEGNAVGMFAGTLRQAGSVQANSVEVVGGRIVLRAKGDVTLAAGSTTRADGVLPGQAGGSVTVRSETGKVLVESGATVSANSQSAAAGSVNLRAAQGDLTVAAGAVISAAGVSGGNIVLQADLGTNAISGLVKATGTLSLSEPLVAKGGSINLLGNQVGLFEQAVIDASGDQGGGTVRLGGDWQGANPVIQNARSSYVAPDATILADARLRGDGGTVVVWADGSTAVLGSIAARGGIDGGNGGNVETSGKQYLMVTRTPQIHSRRNGVGGTWLLDPTTIDIVNGTSSFDVTSTPPFINPTGFSSNSQVSVDLINDALNASGGANVIINTNSSGSGIGDINVYAPISVTQSGDATLSLQATNNINVSAHIGHLNASAGLLNVSLSAGGGINIGAGSTVTTRGGNFDASGISFTNAGTVDVSGRSGLDAGSVTVVVAAALNAGQLLANGGHAIVAGGTGGAGGAINLTSGATVRATLIQTIGGNGADGASNPDGGGAGGAGGAISISAGAISFQNAQLLSQGGDGGAGASVFEAGSRGGDGGNAGRISVDAVRDLDIDFGSTLKSQGGAGGRGGDGVNAGNGGDGGNGGSAGGIGLSGNTIGIYTDSGNEYAGTRGTATLLESIGGRGGDAGHSANATDGAGGSGGFASGIDLNANGSLDTFAALTIRGGAGGNANPTGVSGSGGLGGDIGMLNLSAGSAILFADVITLERGQGGTLSPAADSSVTNHRITAGGDILQSSQTEGRFASSTSPIGLELNAGGSVSVGGSNNQIAAVNGSAGSDFLVRSSTSLDINGAISAGINPTAGGNLSLYASDQGSRITMSNAGPSTILNASGAVNLDGYEGIGLSGAPIAIGTVSGDVNVNTTGLTGHIYLGTYTAAGIEGLTYVNDDSSTQVISLATLTPGLALVIDSGINLGEDRLELDSMGAVRFTNLGAVRADTVSVIARDGAIINEQAVQPAVTSTNNTAGAISLSASLGIGSNTAPLTVAYGGGNTVAAGTIALNAPDDIYIRRYGDPVLLDLVSPIAAGMSLADISLESSSANRVQLSTLTGADITIPVGSDFDFGLRTLELAAGGNIVFSGNGSSTISAGGLVFGGTSTSAVNFSQTGTVDITNNISTSLDVNVASGAVVNLAGQGAEPGHFLGKLTINGGTVSVADYLSVDQLVLNGGTITGSGASSTLFVNDSLVDNLTGVNGGWFDVSITQASGNLQIGQWQAGNIIELKVLAGDLLDGNGVTSNLVAPTVNLTAGAIATGTEADILKVNASAGSASITNTSGAPLVLAGITTSGNFSLVNDGGAITQGADVTVAETTTVSNGTGGAITLTRAGNSFGGVVEASGGAIAISTSGDLSLGPVSASGAVTMRANNLDTTAALSGQKVDLAGTTSLDIQANITSTELVLGSSAGSILIGGSNTGQLQVTSSTLMNIAAAGDITIQGGVPDGASTLVQSVSDATVSAGVGGNGKLIINGGAGAGAFALLDPQTSTSIMTVNADGVELTGGAGAGAYAAIVSSGTVAINSGTDVIITGGTGLDADAVILAANGSISYTGSCASPCTQTQVNPLEFPNYSPFGNGLTDVGLISIFEPAPAPPAPIPTPTPVPPPPPTPGGIDIIPEVLVLQEGLVPPVPINLPDEEEDQEGDDLDC